MNHYVWVEKWRPQVIDDCILPESIKKIFQSYIKQGEISNLLLSGNAGCGKTTVARALCNELGSDVMFINASLENGIDVLRHKISQFASSVSLSGAKKIVILDEADYTNPQSFQPALRGFTEEFSSNCRFILTCNFKHRIIDPIHSRCSVIDFTIPVAEKANLAGLMFKRTCHILEEEGVEYDKKVVAQLINKHFPDFRRTLNELQKYSTSGKIDSGILVDISKESIKELIKHLKEKDFKEVRKWVGLNNDMESNVLFREIYDLSSGIIEPQSIPQLVLILADYGYKSAFVVDKEINTMACLTECMAQLKFK